MPARICLRATRRIALAFFLPLAGHSLITAVRLAAAEPAASPPPADIEFFETKIRPLLANHCYQCHGPEKQKAELRLDSRSGVLAGGDLGPEIVPGKPDDSRLIAAVKYEDPDLQMPPKGKLRAEEIADLARWVAIGAPWGTSASPDPASGGTNAPGSAPDPAKNNSQPAKPAPFDLAARKASHWAWQPMGHYEPPQVANPAWVRQPLDRFILARLEQAGLAPAAAAERHVLIRRASFALTGLPPTPAEVEAFVSDTSPAAWEKVIDRLLASPHFGERWARHWLDLVRYAETRGHEFDYAAADAWQYRDYLIRAFNADVPYDQFVSEHIAGDLLAQPRMDEKEQRNESVIGTGFWYLGEWMHSPVDIRQDEMDRVDNQLDVMGKTFLALTIGCARCHDHKFDAISTRDYYALAGFLHSSSYRDVSFQWQQHNRRIAEEFAALQAKTTDKVLQRVAGAQQKVLDHLADYLLAVRELAQTEPPSEVDAGDGSDASRLQLCQTVAGARLDGAVLKRWWDETLLARKDPLHPLHAWSKATLDARVDSADRLAEVVRGCTADWQKEQQRAGGPIAGERIVDFGQVPPGQWLGDGLAFGGRPTASGLLRLGSTPERPILAIASEPAADTAGRGAVFPGMLRTPTFTISAPSLWYRLRGAADVFVCIDSHRMINGPLHGSTKKHFESEDWKWQQHDLRAYVGHRAHVEFRPREPAKEMAVSVVLQASAAPAEPSRIFAPLAAALGKFTTATAEGSDSPNKDADGAPNGPADANVPAHFARLAGCYQRAFSESCRATFAAPDRTQVDRETLRVAEWCVRHPELFGYGGPAQEEVAGLLKEYQGARGALLAQVKASPQAMAQLDATSVDEHVLLRGSTKSPGPLVPRRYLTALGGEEQPPIGSGSGRLELARQMVDPESPLASRVLVNRVWHHLFGRGIVPSVDNFGVLGERPSHPELLDYLAREFVRDGWSIKRLIRRLLLSSTWQMASRGDPAADAADPLNALVHRAHLRRLEGEAIRDELLALSGRFDERLFGPGIEPHLTDFMVGRGRPPGGPLDGAMRRSIYTKIRRNFLPPMMLAFDMPIPFNTMGRRSVSNVPAQPLILLNDPFVVQMANLWAQRTLASASRSAPDRVRAMYLDAFGRAPTETELQAAEEFLAGEAETLEIPQERRLDDPRLWADLAHVLINTKEFIFLQ